MTLNQLELRGYAEWSLARLANDEDPRDLAAFARHLGALGAEAANPYRYGAPVAPTSPPPATWQPVNLIGQLPTRPGAPPYHGREASGLVGVTLHYTASAPASGVAAVRNIAAYQVGPEAQEDFPAIAYTIIVDGLGVGYLCHSLATRVWHSGAVVDGVSRNKTHVGICYIGNIAPSAAQIDGLAHCIVWCEQLLGRGLPFEGHRDPGYDTLCPGGPTWPGWKAAVQAKVAAFR